MPRARRRDARRLLWLAAAMLVGLAPSPDLHQLRPRQPEAGRVGAQRHAATRTGARGPVSAPCNVEPPSRVRPGAAVYGPSLWTLPSRVSLPKRDHAMGDDERRAAATHRWRHTDHCFSPPPFGRLGERIEIAASTEAALSQDPRQRPGPPICRRSPATPRASNFSSAPVRWPARLRASHHGAALRLTYSRSGARRPMGFGLPRSMVRTRRCQSRSLPRAFPLPAS